MSIDYLNSVYERCIDGIEYADYLTWPEDERIEIIDGVPYMQATPSPEHQLISGELFRQFANYLQGKSCKVYYAPFSNLTLPLSVTNPKLTKKDVMARLT